MIGLVILGIFVVFAIVSVFVVRRHGESSQAQQGWRCTDEVFKDPGSDRTMRVWVDEAGERHYVPER
jgi:hypothetical protein